MSTARTLLVGVGGQGVLTAAQVLGAAAHREGRAVVVGQLHGMSQRGGSLECTVKVGPDECTVIGPGEADVLLAFEPIEALRALPRVGPGTRALVSVGTIVPFAEARSGRDGPGTDAILASLRAEVKDLASIDGPRLVADAGADRTLNAVMLGAAAALGWTAPGADALLAELLARTSPRFRGHNRRAFDLGRAAAQRAQEATT
jgi:indolepyruvate ferredoxin oxidoreductase beta subunit